MCETSAVSRHRLALEQAQADFLAACPAEVEGRDLLPQKNLRSFTALCAADILAMPQQLDLVKGILPPRGVVVIYGPSGSGKSFLVLDMVFGMGEGIPWFNFKVRATPVVYINLEGSLRLRLAAWQMDKKREFPNNVQFVIEPFHILEDVEALAAGIPQGGVVFIDTMNAASPGLDENSSRDMGLILEAAKRLQQITNGLVVIVHHSGKDASKGLRGHSSLYAAMDAVIEVGRNGDARYWRLAKSKEGRDGLRRGFRLKSVGLGYDADGEPVTSCVVDPDNTPVQEEEKPLTPSLEYALHSLAIAAQETGKEHIHLEDWRPVFYRGHSADNPKSKEKAFLRARNGLLSLGKISVTDDKYCIISKETGRHLGDNKETCLQPITDGDRRHGRHPSLEGVPMSPKSDGGPGYE